VRIIGCVLRSHESGLSGVRSGRVREGVGNVQHQCAFVDAGTITL
jgi:hypothetical protein